LAKGLAPKAKKVRNFGSAHLVESLHNRAEILQDGGEAPAAGFTKFGEL